MGCCNSKIAAINGSSDTRRTVQLLELRSSYREACVFFPEILQASVADTPANSELNPVSATALGDFLKLKKVISRNPDLVHYVIIGIRNSVEAIKFLAAIKGKASQCKAIIDEVVGCLELADEGNIDGMMQKTYSLSITKLKELESSGNPFSGFSAEEYIRQTSEQQQAILRDLKLLECKFDKKLRSIKTWRKVWSIAFRVTFAAALVCSVVLAAVVTPHVASAAATGTATAIAAMEGWFDTRWEGQEEALGDEQEVVKKMYVGTISLIREADSVRVLAEQLINHIGSLSWTAEFMTSGKNKEATFQVGVEEIKREFSEFSNSADNLESHVDLCTHQIGRVLAEFMKIIIE